jgi:hypothetical protein
LTTSGTIGGIVCFVWLVAGSPPSVVAGPLELVASIRKLDRQVQHCGKQGTSYLFAGKALFGKETARLGCKTDGFARLWIVRLTVARFAGTITTKLNLQFPRACK